MLSYKPMTLNDILWIVATFAFVIFAACLSYAIYHIALAARRVHQVLEEGKAMLHDLRASIVNLGKKLDVYEKLIVPLMSLAHTAIAARKERKEVGIEELKN